MSSAARSAPRRRCGTWSIAKTSSPCIAGGHEIACHTFSHKRACDLDAETLSAEIERNQQYLRSLDSSIRIENFAYPFGYGSFVRKRQLKTVFQSCRSIVPGVNSGTVDLQFLRAMPLIDRRIDRDGIERAFDAGANR